MTFIEKVTIETVKAGLRVDLQKPDPCMCNIRKSWFSQPTVSSAFSWLNLCMVSNKSRSHDSLLFAALNKLVSCCLVVKGDILDVISHVHKCNI